VKLPFSLFLALRYLKPKRTFVSVITLISVAGVMIGVAALIVVLAVMTGFDHELRRKVLGFEAHLVVGSREGVMSDWEPVRESLDRTPGIEASAPFVMGPVLLERESQFVAGKMRGIELASEQRISSLAEFIKEGALDLDGDKCVMGRELAASLGVTVGDKILFHGPGNLREVMNELKKAEAKDPGAKAIGEIRQLIQPAELEVTGLFETGRFQYDAEFALVPLHVAQEIYGLPGDIHGVTLRTRDPYWAEQFKPELRSQLGPAFSVTSWIDQNKQLFDAIQIERGTMFVILLLIVGVAAFAIMNTLITVTVQKRREIGIQKALGARPGQVMWVFLAQGGVVGVLGILAGAGLGFLMLAWRNEFRDFLSRVMGIEIFPKGIYQFSQIPAEVVPRDVATICIASFVACTIAGMLPALFAAWTDPVKALREE
jgi:lipoprotein-releasing system permease protein